MKPDMRPLPVLLGTFLAAAAPSAAPPIALAAPPARGAATPNTLTPAERRAGVRLLFDGKTTTGWRGFKQAGFPARGWRVEGGELRFVPSEGKEPGPGDLVTEDEFDSFELSLEFRLAPGGNSGIKYLVDEALVTKEGARSGLGFEYQILDDERHPDAKNGKPGTRTVGALYDLVAPAPGKVVNPPGQWNEARLVVAGARVEHWLNGKRVVAYERGSDALRALVAGSKYRSIPGFGEAEKGRILLQDHGDEVAFRNIKLRPIPRAEGTPAKPAAAASPAPAR